MKAPGKLPPPQPKARPKTYAKNGRPFSNGMFYEFDSYDQMSTATGIPRAVLANSKKAGCPFVKHGRLELRAFLVWYFTTQIDKEAQENWSQRDKRAAALIKEEDLAKKQKSVIDFAQSTRFANHLVNEFFFTELDRLAQEFPPNLKGKDEITIHREVIRQMERIKTGLRDKLEEIKKGDIDEE